MRLPCSLAEVHRWMAETKDLELWAAVYAVLGKGFYRIKPEPEMEETCSFLTRYLLRCIHEDAASDAIPSGYEAGCDLSNCLKHWATKLPVTHLVLRVTVASITDAYLHANVAERDRLLLGTVEHALEAPAIRPYFRQWENDAVLAEPLRDAMAWAMEHEDTAAG